MPRTIAPLILLLIMAGCNNAPAENSGSIKTAQDRRASRIVKAQAVVSVTPTPRSYHFDGSELKVIDVPVADSAGFVDLQHCFIWRDAEFRTSTISCPSEQTPVPEAGPEPVDYNY